MMQRMVPRSSLILAWLLVVHQVAGVWDPVDAGLFFVQAKASAVFRSHQQITQKPWEVYRYLTCLHHKAGTQLARDVTLYLLLAVGIDGGKGDGEELKNNICFYDRCLNADAPVHVEAFCSSEEVNRARRLAAPHQLRVVNTVRDPMDMVASAYCYHHRWEEWDNPFYGPILQVEFMGFQDGVNFMAEGMLETVTNMTSIAEHPGEHSHNIPYEIITRSSEDFDREVGELIDFMFRGLNVTAAEREKMQIFAMPFDLHRHPDLETKHTNSDSCMSKARAAARAMRPDLLMKYQAFQSRLGYGRA